MLAESHALSATDAVVVIDHCLVLGVERKGMVVAMAHAYAAAYAVVAVDCGFRVSVHLQLSPYRAAAHAEVLQCAAESGHLMPLEVGERDDDVGVGQGCSNLRSLAIFGVVEWNLAVFNTLDTVGDDNWSLHGYRIEAVLHSRLDMVHTI